MTFLRPDRAATLALVLAACLTPLAQAGGFGCRCRNNCSETAAPRVTTHEMYQPSQGLVMPVLGTAFAPLALPVATFGIAAYSPRGIDPSQEDNALRSPHAAEVLKMRHTKAFAAAKAEVEAAKNVIDRMATPAEPRQAASPSDTTDLEKRIQELSDCVAKLAERVTAVEKLTLIHDNYLRGEKIHKPNTPH